VRVAVRIAVCAAVCVAVCVAVLALRRPKKCARSGARALCLLQ